ncbi:Yip1 family protein [Cognatiluteimonas lumbrici]|uniref:Yip1 family protein n=1 Tax=Cognatiluteimonas lumbrici TaxID=2559601 RepID=UPI001129B23F|nr:Yip1 family protein [Luteimonas lumbrici]
MDSNALIARVKGILLAPKAEWPVIAGEPATVKGLYTGYAMILAAIPAVFGFIKGSFIGHSLFGVTVTTPIAAGLVGMVVGYALGLAMLYVVALVVNALAPSFGGEKDQVQALKTVVYAWTASWVAGIANIVPWIGWLVLLAGGIYSIYLLYLGLPHTMKCPPDKAIGYTAVSVIVTIVLSWILALVVGGITAMGGLAGAAAMGGDGAEVSFDKDSRLGRLAEMSRRMEAAAEANKEAAESDDPQVQAQAMAAMMGAMAGREDGQPAESLAPDQLKAFLPGTLGGLERQSLSANRQAAMGMQVSEASATYADDAQRVEIEVTDLVALGGMMAMATAFGGESESESESGYERTYVRDGQRIHERWDATSGYGEYSVLVGDRFQVEASGQVADMGQLKRMVGSMDLDGLARLKDAGAR